ncbi:MAG: hypothetical protein LPK45_07355 [Bacteroidota bacterium]|nr:hypothetical protein [Bacteroidota bacterium]MDX5430891.1 hypothetical protein [Bacteroidota bacterium]MDX5469638.1 hypothetical protein [Bacteroidota bacterium]
MEYLLKHMAYEPFRKVFFFYQLGASVLVCTPIFLSLFILIGLPHLFFILMTALIHKSPPSQAKRALHFIMLLYYGGLLALSCWVYPELLDSWPHSDSIDQLIHAQMLILPFVLGIQLYLILVEIGQPILLPHEQSQTNQASSSFLT